MLKYWPILHMNVSYTTISDFSFFFLSHSLAFNELLKCRNEFPTPTLKHTHSSFALQTFVSILELRTKCKFIFNRSSCTFFVFFSKSTLQVIKQMKEASKKKKKNHLFGIVTVWHKLHTVLSLFVFFFLFSHWHETTTKTNNSYILFINVLTLVHVVVGILRGNIE